MVFTQMTIEEVNRDCVEKEDSLVEVHKMRAGTRRELHLIEQLKATTEGQLLETLRSDYQERVVKKGRDAERNREREILLQELDLMSSLLACEKEHTRKCERAGREGILLTNSETRAASVDRAFGDEDGAFGDEDAINGELKEEADEQEQEEDVLEGGSGQGEHEHEHGYEHGHDHEHEQEYEHEQEHEEREEYTNRNSCEGILKDKTIAANAEAAQRRGGEKAVEESLARGRG
eukprot:CAMPEP_0179463680 /NCGR_PEP_ID=MMETSP0799-20121207/45677_1 /TAXON_ID=46947 /ORGANISM="Geminigera cryophila, Strain CCMP2564" /LENGTH=233 /DNA_ID=CAMNT_0021267067 /DNA_START=81 /DNA_END=778 /DNA_ORIENTATION=+